MTEPEVPQEPLKPPADPVVSDKDHRVPDIDTDLPPVVVLDTDQADKPTT